MGGGRTAREDPVNPRAPLVVALDMGYGHLRAAAALADAAGTSVVEADRPPLADAEEQAAWRRARSFYEALSRATDLPVVGPAFRGVLDSITRIPRLSATGDMTRPTAAVRMLRRMADKGLGRGLVGHLRTSGRPLLTTFYAPAIVAADAGLDGVTCVVTDVDVNRVWVPRDGAGSRITYCVPAERTAQRLLRYGVAEERIRRTGFPLPGVLVGGEDLVAAKSNLASRLARLDPSGAFRRAAADEIGAHLGDVAGDVSAARRGDGPPLIAILVGGAGAQVAVALEILAALGGGIVRGRWRVALVAGTRAAVADAFRVEVDRLGLSERLGSGVEILYAPTFEGYLAEFHALLARTDVVWTKPSEMTFYAALGIPLLLARPLGVHERANRRWVKASGAAFDAKSGHRVLTHLERGLADGALAAAAWNGFLRLPKHGTLRILGI